MSLVQDMMNMATKGNKSGSATTDPLKLVQSAGITNTKFEGLTEAEKNKTGLVTGEVMQAGYAELDKKNAKETLKKFEAILKLTDPNGDYGITVTSLLRKGSTDHSQGLAIDIGSTKGKKYLFRYYAEKLVPLFWKVKWAQIVRTIEADPERLRQFGVYKMFLSLHNYHIHISTNPNRGRAFGFETYNGSDVNLSSSYPILPYNSENMKKAMEWYDVTSSEVITDNSIELISDNIKGIGSSVVDNATESPSKFLGAFSVIALIVLAILFFFKGVKE